MRRVLPFLLLLPTAALAQADDVDPETGRIIRYQRQTEIDFDARAVEATIVGPSIQYVSEPPRGDFNPLIRLRRDFRPELEQSIDDVK